MTADAAFDVLVLAVARGADATTQIAVPAANVREVARIDRVTEYPGAPADVPGIAAVRGQIVPVLDLAPHAGGPRAVVLLVAGPLTLALAGGAPLRITAALGADDASNTAPLRVWSGRVLPVAGAVRLHDASRPDAADGPVLPLLDAAALIRDVVDESEGGR